MHIAGLDPTTPHAAAHAVAMYAGTKITGGKVLSGKTKHCPNRAAQALKLAAAALRSSQSALGAYFRRLSSGMDFALAPLPPPITNLPD